MKKVLSVTLAIILTFAMVLGVAAAEKVDSGKGELTISYSGKFENQEYIFDDKLYEKDNEYTLKFDITNITTTLDNPAYSPGGFRFPLPKEGHGTNDGERAVGWYSGQTGLTWDVLKDSKAIVFETTKNPGTLHGAMQGDGVGWTNVQDINNYVFTGSRAIILWEDNGYDLSTFNDPASWFQIFIGANWGEKWNDLGITNVYLLTTTDHVGGGTAETASLQKTIPGPSVSHTDLGAQLYAMSKTWSWVDLAEIEPLAATNNILTDVLDEKVLGFTIGNLGQFGLQIRVAEDSESKFELDSLKIKVSFDYVLERGAPAEVDLNATDKGNGKWELEVGEAEIDELLTLAGTRPVRLNADKATGGKATTIVIPFEALEAFAEAGNDVILTMPEGVFLIPKGVLADIVDQAKNKDLEFTVTEVDEDSKILTDEQKEYLEDKEDIAIFTITIMAGDVKITKLDGSLDITLQWDGKKASVFYLPEDGSEPEKMNTANSAGRVSFETNHLSIFFIEEDPDAATTPNTGVIMFFGIAGTVLAASGTGAVLFARKLKKR